MRAPILDSQLRRSQFIVRYSHLMFPCLAPSNVFIIRTILLIVDRLVRHPPTCHWASVLPLRSRYWKFPLSDRPPRLQHFHPTLSSSPKSVPSPYRSSLLLGLQWFVQLISLSFPIMTLLGPRRCLRPVGALSYLLKSLSSWLIVTSPAKDCWSARKSSLRPPSQ